MEAYLPASKQSLVTNTGGLLGHLPVELAARIFTFLPSLTDVFAVASTSHHFRNVWLNNVHRVYEHVARRTIPCLRKARAFLAAQGGPGIRDPVTALDIRCMVRYSIIIEKSIILFEKQVVPRLRMGGIPPGEYYGKGARRHPPTLTNTERLRFIRNYYKLWELIKIDRTAWESRLESMHLKELFHLSEMCNLYQSIGNEEIIPLDPNGDMRPVSTPPQYTRSMRRQALVEVIWARIDTEYMRIHGERFWCLGGLQYEKEDGACGFVCLWDYWQDSLKQCVCGLGPPREFSKLELWENSSAEEIE